MANIRINDHSKEFLSSFDKAISAALEGVGIHIEGEAKEELENTPRRIDTGNLRNSITHDVEESKKTVYIGTNVEYGIYVHEGTSKMAPNRFLKNAVERNKEQIKDYFKNTLK